MASGEWCVIASLSSLSPFACSSLAGTSYFELFLSLQQLGDEQHIL